MPEATYALIRFQETGDSKARAGLLVGDRVLPLDGDINSLIEHWDTTEGQLDTTRRIGRRGRPAWRWPTSRSSPRWSLPRSCRPAPTTAST